MAIGDTVQAGLMRVDSSPILLAGQAQAKANQAFGDALGGVVEKFYQKKKDKQGRDEREQAYLKMGLTSEEAKAASRDKELANQFINKMNADRNFFLAQQEGLIEKEKEKRAADQFDLKREKTESDDLARDNFLKKLFTPVPTGKLNEAGQDELERGSLFLAPTPEAQENFKNELLQNPQFQKTEPVFNMTGKRLLNQFAKEKPDVQKLALTYMQSRQKDAPTISRLVNMEDGQGGFQQVGVDSAGNPIRTFGPPKPSGMFATPEQQAEARAKTLSVDNANEFVNTQRNEALESAKSIVPATRALTLLEKGDLETGGITEFKTNVTAMLDSLGIPIPKEIMDKVSNTQTFRAEVGDFLFQNIGKTKGTISDNEMRIFTSISPGLQMTPEANKVLLEYIIKKAERDKNKVKFIQKMRRDGVSIIEQRNRLEDYILDNDLSEILSPIAGQTSEQQNFRTPQGEVKGEVVGVKPDGSKLIKVGGKIFVQPAQ
jgi:hypothetical protein